MIVTEEDITRAIKIATGQVEKKPLSDEDAVFFKKIKKIIPPIKFNRKFQKEKQKGEIQEMSNSDRSINSLLTRLEIAEKVTPGPWWVDSASFFAPFRYTIKCKNGNITGLNYKEDANHIAANDPTTIIDDINEILDLRKENEELKNEIKTLKENLDKLTSKSTPEKFEMKKIIHKGLVWCKDIGGYRLKK